MSPRKIECFVNKDLEYWIEKEYKFIAQSVHVKILHSI